MVELSIEGMELFFLAISFSFFVVLPVAMEEKLNTELGVAVSTEVTHRFCLACIETIRP